MKMSEQLDQLATSLAKAQSEMDNVTKNAANPHFRSKYADLAEVLNTVRPVLAKHGLSVVQTTTYSEGVCSVETLLLHASGQYLAEVASAPVVKADPQGVGSATTYLRRYALAAIAGVAQEDDDGNAAGRPPPKVATAPAKRAASQALLDAARDAAAKKTIPEGLKLSEPEAFALRALVGLEAGERAEGAKAWLRAQMGQP
jgi:hypothetical protein